MAKAAAHALAEAAASNDMSEELEGEHGEEGENSEVAFGGATFQVSTVTLLYIICSDLKPFWFACAMFLIAETLLFHVLFHF